MTLRGAPVTAALMIAMVAIELTFQVMPALREWAYLDYAFYIFVGSDEGFLVGGRRVEAQLGWPLLTHAALHGGLLHLGFNCAALAIFGPPVERSVGSPAFALAFLAAAAAGALAHFGWIIAQLALGYSPAAPLMLLVGASGAISGILALEIMRRVKSIAQLPAALRPMSPGAYLRSSSITFILINIAITLLPGFISGEAHIGGFIAGLILGPVLLRRVVN